MKKLKLDKLSSKRFDEKELSKLKGGSRHCSCTCNCFCDSGDDADDSSIDLTWDLNVDGSAADVY